MNTLFPLNPVEHIFTGIGSYPIDFIFYYKGHLDENRLKESFQELIRYFPVVNSRLEKISESSLGLRICENGYEFETRDSDADFQDQDSRSSFISSVETFENNPLVKIRLTYLPKGTVLGVSISHAISDGFGYFHFLASWAKLFHRLSVFHPGLDRQNMVFPAIDNTEEINEEKIYNDCGLYLGEKRETYNREQQTWDVKRYSGEELHSLISQIQGTCTTRLSVNDILSALLWKEYLAKWNISGEETISYFTCPVDFRRILPGFPKTYFGDALCFASAKLPYDRLLSSSNGDLALLIRESVASVQPGYIMRSIATLEKIREQHGTGIMENIHVAHPDSGMLVTNLSRLPVNEIQFNCGAPISFDILTTAPRGAVILPHRDGIEIRVCQPLK